MLRKDKKIELLRATPLFAKCNKRQLSAVASSADLVDVPAGTRLVAEGRSDREFMVIIEGAVDVLRAGETINRLRSGDFFGEIALLAGGTRTASVTATVPTTLLVVTPQAFRAITAEMPELRVRVLEALVERLRPLAI